MKNSKNWYKTLTASMIAVEKVVRPKIRLEL